MKYTIHHGDCLETLKTLPDESVNCCITSPPYYGLRDYGVDGQIGLESTPDEYVQKMAAVFREVRRVLRDDGTCWLNLGDSYSKETSTTGGYSDKSTLCGFTGEHTKGRVMNRAESRRKITTGLKPKDLIGIPWRVAFALQADGWYLRQDIIWHKPNPMPESVTDRCTKAHEYIFLLTKSARYWYDAEAVREPISQTTFDRWGDDPYTKRRPNGQPTYIQFKGAQSCGVNPHGRNRRSVWTVATQPYSEAHFAVFPPKLIEPCVLAGCPEGGTILDPFTGSGTTGHMAIKHNRRFIGCELNAEYIKLAEARINEAVEDNALFEGATV